MVVVPHILPGRVLIRPSLHLVKALGKGELATSSFTAMHSILKSRIPFRLSSFLLAFWGRSPTTRTMRTMTFEGRERRKEEAIMKRVSVISAPFLAASNPLLPAATLRDIVALIQGVSYTFVPRKDAILLLLARTIAVNISVLGIRTLCSIL
jgi:hypothetical protein